MGETATCSRAISSDLTMERAVVAFAEPPREEIEAGPPEVMQDSGSGASSAPRPAQGPGNTSVTCPLRCVSKFGRNSKARRSENIAQQGSRLNTTVDKNDPLRLLKRNDHDRTALYGAIKFPTSKGSAAKWACVAHDSSPDLIIKMFKGSAWKLSPPRVVISVTGAARFSDESQLSDRVEMQFRRGLQRAVLATNGWIVTGGTSKGVMGMVGRMMQDLDESVAEEIVLLGVASWGVIAEHAEMNQMQPGKIFNYPDPDIVPLRGARLDSNHTHFLLVEDGTEWQFGAEIQLRSALEHALSRWSQETSGGIDAPKVLLVVGGGIGTLRTVLQQLQSKTPVVVIEEGGGASRHLHLFWSKGEAVAKAMVLAELKDMAPSDQDMYVELLSTIIPLGRKRQDANNTEQLSFFIGSNVQGSRNELDQVILRAILSDCERTVDAVMHAVLWGQPSIIRHQLQCSREADPHGLGQAFEQALLAAQRSHNYEARRVLQELIKFNVQPSHVRFDLLFENVKQSRHLEMLRGWRDKSSCSDGPPVKAMRASRSRSDGETIVASGRRGRSRFAEVVLDVYHGLRRSCLGSDRMRMSQSSGLRVGTEREAGINQLSEEFEFAGYDVFTRERVMSHYRACAVWNKGFAARKQTQHSHQAFPPEWIDLMMWAVLNGRTVLARPLFEKTEEPLRAALMASRYCQRRALLESHPVEKDGWMEQAGTYEEWAMGVLDAVTDSSDAVQLLTMIPRKRGRPMWPRSVMDSATSDEFPCQRFVAHKHCQKVLDDYWSGDFPGSRVRISTAANVSSVALQILFCGFLPDWLSSCAIIRRQADDIMQVEELSPVTDDDDADFFTSMFTLGDTSGFWWSWWSFWGIPKVRYTCHSIALFVYVGLISMLVGFPTGWLSHSGELEPSMLELMQPETQQPTGITELMIWLSTLGTFVDDIAAISRGWRKRDELKAYFGDSWHQINLVFSGLMLTCFVLRVISSAYSPDTQPVLLEASRCLLAVAICVLFLRLLGALAIFPNVGVMTGIFMSMLRDSTPFLAMISVFTFGFGVAYTALQPSPTLFGDRQWSERSWARPFWSIVGYTYTPDQLDAADEPGIVRVVLPLLLFVYSLIVCVMIVNLMIAQISASFTELQISSNNFRLFQRVKLLKEYKDVKRAPPPLNLVLHPIVLLMRCVHNVHEQRSGFSSQKNSTTSKELRSKEQTALRSYIKLSKSFDAQTIESRVKRVDEGIDRLEDEMRRGFDWLTTRVDRMQMGSPDALLDSLQVISKQNAALQEEMRALKSSMMGTLSMETV
ncbi:hypothetical protein AB1Y20_002239 [Prymnesium parvum]|uniref:Transient receptor potential cation channel subfamily M member 2 n=1 Tax=Prymnesium parvum TaxID=97485 RepID=A0AB34J9U0_PRYPA